MFIYSKSKFFDFKEMFDVLYDWGYKCSINIMLIVSCNIDENGVYSLYKVLDIGKDKGIFVMNIKEDGSGMYDLYIGNVNYGCGYFIWGYYFDLGCYDVQKWWGEQYCDFLDWGLDFVW